MHLSFEKRLSKEGITVAGWCVLVALHGEHASSISELSTYIEIDKASISRVVLRLTERGLISHQKGKDRRSGYLQLTKDGIALMPFLLEEAQQNEDYYFENASKKEIHNLKNILLKILEKSPSQQFEGWLNTEKKNL
jgi:DNA-binding MarR family transcriptional regulator